MDLRGEPDILGVTPFAPQRPRMSNCKYFQVCNLPGQVIINQEPYCVFHDPRREKTRSEFEYQLSRLVNKGVSDFRNFVFPQGSSFKYENQTFRNLLNLEGVALDTLLDLTGATLQCGLSLSVQKINSINIRNVTTHGPVTISVEDKMDTFNCEGIRAASSIHFSAKSCERVLFGRSDVIERVAIVIESMIRDASFQDAHLHGDLDLQCSSIATLIIGDAVITKSTRVALDSGEVTIRAAGCHLQGESTLNAKRIAELNLNGATIDGLLTTKARIYKLNCIGTKVKVGMDFRDCHFGTGNHREGDKVSFDRTTFEESSFLGLSGSSIDGDLTITGNLTPPRSINIDGCTIKKDTVIRSEVGRPSIKLVAPQKRPDFHGKVLVENVSLAECRLLGNPINRMEMRNVEWKQENNRAVLYDEIVLRKISTELTPTATKALKEAYQILKEQYRTLGDHVTSGDFHYGEMEMKRREYSWVGRHFGLTGLYYALSGYGTHPWRAFRFLCYFLVLVTGLFALGQDGTLTDIVLKSAELTLQAASLQPLTATQFERVSPYVRAVFQIARIVIPLQAALLALAIRMRLKR